MMEYHTPVLLHESIQGLNITKGGIYVDATYGGGGHSAEILKKMSGGRLFAFDQDKDAEANIIRDDRLCFIRHNFRYLSNFMKYHGVTSIDGILADLGVSSHQFDLPERGFSYRQRGVLDMRMNTGAAKNARLILNSYDEAGLQRIFSRYGEVVNAGRIARLIIRYRKTREIIYTDQLAELLQPVIPGNQEIKYLSRVFQALRIEVNQELSSLGELMLQSARLLRPGGRMVVISYHSVEDRLVKNFFRAGNFEGKIQKDLYGRYERPFRQLHNKVIVPDEAEIALNKRARSAKMRIAERTA